MKKALIAMSGGVDSSVAAYLTMQAGYECIGCTMRLYDNEDAGLAAEKTCCSLDDTEDARAVANRLGIPFYVFNFTDLFREKVIGNFVSCYLCGKTPNPCIECNRYLKFEKLLERAEALGCDKVVTGHYAQIVETDAGYQLRRGADHSKDQSYVLYMLTQAQLSHIMLPLGGMTKTEVRAIAEAQGFVTAHKRDSQDICFVPDGDYARIVEQQSGITPEGGDFVDLLRADGDALRVRGDAAVARKRVDDLDRGVFLQLFDDRVLAASAADNHKFHLSDLLICLPLEGKVARRAG